MPDAENRTPQAEKIVAPDKKKQTLKMLGVLLLVMAVEGGGIYFAVKYFGGGPQTVAAEGLAPIGGHGEAAGGGHSEGGAGRAAAGMSDAELPVVKVKAPNMKTGRLFLYDIEIYAKAKKEHADQLQALLDGYKATIEDRLNRIVRAAEPQDLHEDGLQTIRRQIKHELGQIVGDQKMIEEILIPKCTPYKVDY